jgi:hypothetical protein
MTLTPQAQELQDKYEIRPDPVALTQNSDASQNAPTGVDYEPHPENSIKVDEKQQKIVDSICRLYSGSASEDDMQVYATEAIYDDPWSYCDTRYKIAGQWYGTGFDFLLHLYLFTSREPWLDFCLRHLQASP